MPPDLHKCLIGSNLQNKPQVLLLGDSHAFSDIGMINVFLKNAELTGIVITESDNLFLLNKKYLSLNSASKKNTILSKMIKKNHYKYVVIASFWEGYKFNSNNKNSVSLDQVKNGLENSVKLIINSGATPVIVLDTPTLSDVPYNCGFTKININNKCYNDLAKVLDFEKKSKNLIINLQEEFPKLILINPSKVICNNSMCYTSLNKMPLYFNHIPRLNNSHLNYEGSKLIGEIYLEKYGNPF